MPKRILITGGFGYLGGRLAVELAKNMNYLVRLGTRKHQASPTWLPDAEIAEMDFFEPLSLKNVLKDVHLVVHLAAMNADECLARPDEAISFNIGGTHRLLQAAILAGVERFIYLSTAHVYGSPLVGHITEETSTTSLHPYASSHRAAEDVVRHAHDSEKIEGIVVRLSNAYGPPVHQGVNCWKLLVNDLCRQAVVTQKMVLNSSGVQRRDFISISEVCCAIEHLFDVPKQALGTGLFNVGGAWSPTVWEMAKLVQERCEAILGFRPALSRVPPQSGGNPLILDYCSEHFDKTGFQRTTDKIEEIDSLLVFCKR